MFGLTSKDVGRPLQDLEVSYRPLELRTLIEQVYANRRGLTTEEFAWRPDSGGVHYLEAQFNPLSDNDANLIGVSITFTDVTAQRRLQDQLQQANQELETAMEELQSTNEELETTNEELHSTVEELETTNEELQSTNEELETMNEELQSTNEELETANTEMNERSDALNELNAFLSSILTGLRSGVVVVDRDLKIEVWNYRAEDLWGLRADEVRGGNFLNLDIGLPVERLKPALRKCLSGESKFVELSLPATTRRGKKIQVQITCSPRYGPNKQIRGVIVMIDELDSTSNP
jgi:two-component system CheB/CheR fusion protein